jgi:hypothetical protein
MGTPIAQMLQAALANQQREQQRMQALQNAQAADPNATLESLGELGQPTIATQGIVDRVAAGNAEDPLSGLASLYRRLVLGGGQAQQQAQATPVPLATPDPNWSVGSPAEEAIRKQQARDQYFNR